MSGRDLDPRQAAVPPHSAEAEQGVLGAVLLDNRAWERVSGLLAERDFYVAGHGTIWAAAARLIEAGKPADVVTVFDALGTVAEDCGGLAYLNALVLAVPSIGNARRYAEIVRQRSVQRQVVALAGDLRDAVLAPDAPDVHALVDSTVTALLDLVGGVRAAGQEPLWVEALLGGFIDHLEALASGQVLRIETGIRRLDDALGGGGGAGELAVLGARPSMGKSALVQTIALNVARTHGVLVLSQEDSALAWLARATANLGRINLADVRRPQQAPDSDALWTRVTDGVEQLRGRRLLLDEQGGLTLGDVRRKVLQARRAAGEAGLALVIIDYLQLMTGEGDNRNQMLGAVANGLKALAKEQGVWVILLSQLSRKADETAGLPQMAHLRDSGDIEGAADTIMLLHREAQRKRTDENAAWAQLHLCKVKNGVTCTINLTFDGGYQRFSDWDGPVPRGGGGGGMARGDGGMN